MLEIIVVTSIVAILALAGFPLMSKVQTSSQLNENTSLLVQTLRTAQQKSVAWENNSNHGVFFEINPNAPDAYILFQGSSYATRTASYDRRIELTGGINVATSLNDDEIVFENGLGTAIMPKAEASVQLSDVNGYIRTITIYRRGLIELMTEFQ